jgi:hypothetical protein
MPNTHTSDRTGNDIEAGSALRARAPEGPARARRDGANALRLKTGVKAGAGNAPSSQAAHYDAFPL